MKKASQKSLGFTLIEMIVTVTIAAILASIAVPSFSKMIERNRISSATNEFLSALILARSEAVKRSQNVTLCVSSNQTACDVTSKDYAKGWMIFSECDAGTAGFLDTTNVCDTNGDGTVDSPETPLKVHDELPRLAIKTDTAHEKFMTYNFSGRSDNFSFFVGKDASTKTKEIQLSRTGRVQSCDYTASPAGC